VFVPPTVAPRDPEPADLARGAGGREDLLPALARYRRIVLSGPEGSGKTTLARWLAAVMLPPAWSPVLEHDAAQPAAGHVLPIFLSLDTLVPGQYEPPDAAAERWSIEDLIRAHFAEARAALGGPGRDVTLRALQPFFETGRVLLILDGLDRVHCSFCEDTVAFWLERFLDEGRERSWPSPYLLVTSRSRRAGLPMEVRRSGTRYVVVPSTDAQVRDQLDRLARALQTHFGRAGTRAAPGAWEALRAPERAALLELARRPGMAALFGLVWACAQTRGDLPPARPSDLFRQVTSLYLDALASHAPRPQLSRRTLVTALSKLATAGLSSYLLRTRDGRVPTTWPRDMLMKRLERILSPAEAHAFLSHMLAWNGLLHRSLGGAVSFRDVELEEYLSTHAYPDTLDVPQGLWGGAGASTNRTPQPPCWTRPPSPTERPTEPRLPSAQEDTSGVWSEDPAGSRSWAALAWSSTPRPPGPRFEAWRRHEERCEFEDERVHACPTRRARWGPTPQGAPHRLLRRLPVEWLLTSPDSWLWDALAAHDAGAEGEPLRRARRLLAAGYTLSAARPPVRIPPLDDAYWDARVAREPASARYIRRMQHRLSMAEPPRVPAEHPPRPDAWALTALWARMVRRGWVRGPARWVGGDALRARICQAEEALALRENPWVDPRWETVARPRTAPSFEEAVRLATRVVFELGFERQGQAMAGTIEIVTYGHRPLPSYLRGAMRRFLWAALGASLEPGPVGGPEALEELLAWALAGAPAGPRGAVARRLLPIAELAEELHRLQHGGRARTGWAVLERAADALAEAGEAYADEEGR